eukprot:TRINITY_DN20133_c0_g1_i5.p1 TRINITY_DN20133_c0_g1~~TRINITY_DN20133_c0_g1_i5.p1  ORF type:complete len:496 (-),score=68.69 TRINITY_DN20133_c0_g1_i5:218-1705(-)
MEALQIEPPQGDGGRVTVRVQAQSFLTTTDGGRRRTLIGAQNAGGSSVLSAIINTTNTIMGTGTLAIPAAMKCSGVLAYELVMCGVFVATCVSMRWLIAVAEALPTEQPRNYESIARVYLGNGAATAITGAFIFGGMALNVSYIIMIGACLSPIAISILDLSGGDGNQAQAELFIRWGVGLLIVLPLSCLRDISKLKVTSSIAIVTLSYAALYVVKQGEVHIKANGISPTFSWYFLSSNIFTCMAMTVSAFSCHISAMPIYESLGQRRSPRTMMTVVMVSLVLSAIVYHCVGLTGYMQFGADVKGNVLESVATINTDDEWMWLANAGMSTTLIFSMPIVMWPLRSCTLSAYPAWIAYLASSRGGAAVDVDVSAPPQPSPRVVAHSEPSAAEWYSATAALLLAVLTIATLIPKVTIIMAIGGSVGGAFIVFIYPAAFYLAIVKKEKPQDMLRSRNAPQLAMIAIGVILGLICFCHSIQNAFYEIRQMAMSDGYAVA